MSSEGFFTQLQHGVAAAIAEGRQHIVFWGDTRTSLRLIEYLRQQGLQARVEAVIDNAHSTSGEVGGIDLIPAESLGVRPIDTIVVTEDARKEEVLRQAAHFLKGDVRVILAGIGHLAFQDRTFQSLVGSLFVSSRAAGYSNMLVHLYQSLQHIARRGIEGNIAEFGVYKGGTTVFLARAAKALGIDAQIYGFDMFAGFPERQSLLDLYSDPHDVFEDYDAVERYCKPYPIRLVRGDIRETYTELAGVPLALSFFDTDNYSPTKAALDLCVQQTVTGGIIAFDHYFCDERWLYTLGERIAVDEVLGPADGFFNLHGTGVFLKL